ncbi:MAG: C69 family dipeptidase [Candidatus Marinimicrobia bacterium]|nr:C69 family dipeptidase [Candidatus Neomarinimicrobiota bacterium]
MKRLILFLICFTFLFLQQDWGGSYPDGCTSIMVGRKATVDGSAITSHTCDSHRSRGWLDIVSPMKHKRTDMVTLVKRIECETTAMPLYIYVPTGKIPQVKYTHGFINTAYPCMNEHQLAVG